MVNKVNSQNLNMSELTIDNDILETNETESDADVCDGLELEKTFSKTYTINAEKALTLDKTYILHISCTRESVPKICVGLSNNNCEIYNISNNQINKITALDSHETNIINVKFSSDTNLLYTGSSDCTIKLWDLRTNKNVLEFKDKTTENEVKPLLSFDVSANNRILCGGTELYENDAFLLFWDIRNAKLLGGYWESHTDDITKVLFHPTDKDKLASGSTDGLINIFDLKETNEDDALLNSINTDSSVEQLLWYGKDYKDICCITHTVDVQLWDTEEATPLGNFGREDVAKTMKRKSAEHTYIANAHLNKTKGIFLLTGSNWHKGECVRTLNIENNNTLTPHFKLKQNKQRIRASWYNEQNELLITGGEQCILSIWKQSNIDDDNKMNSSLKLENKSRKQNNKPY